MSVNVQNLTILRDAILSAPENFDMKLWSRSRNGPWPTTSRDVIERTCGTTACIGGWASVLFFPESACPIEVSEREIAGVLGLAYEHAHELFYPKDEAHANGGNPYSATNVEAVRVLDHLIETGEVDWNKAFA